jgi:hypothetical protein
VRGERLRSLANIKLKHVVAGDTPPRPPPQTSGGGSAPDTI